MKRFAVFVSGSGSNLQVLIDAVNMGEIDGKICAVIASKPDIFALERAEKADIPAYVFERKDYQSASEMYGEIGTLLEGLSADFIVLAGYLSILTPNIVDRFRDKIINIHPSLIPLHCGSGFYGRKVHESVLLSGDEFSGATVHFVDEGTDTGRIIRRRRVKVREGDTPDSLAARVQRAEHKLLTLVVAAMCGDRIVECGGKVRIKCKPKYGEGAIK